MPRMSRTVVKEGGQSYAAFASSMGGLTDALKRNERGFADLKKKIKDILKDVDLAKLKGGEKAAAEEIAKDLKEPSMDNLQKVAERLKTLGTTVSGSVTGVAGKKRAVGIYCAYASWWTILIWAKGRHIARRMAKVAAAAAANPAQNPGAPPDVMELGPDGKTVKVSDANDAIGRLKGDADATQAGNSVKRINKKLVRCDAPTQADAQELAKVFDTPSPSH